MMRLVRQIFRGLFFLGAVVTLIGGSIWVFNTVLRVWHERQVCGLLDFSVGLKTPMTLTAGSFHINWTPEKGGRLAISHLDHTDGVLWEAAPGCAFAGAAQACESVAEHRGMFFVREKVLKRFPHQYIEEITAQKDGSVRISGYLAATPGKPDVPYNFYLLEINPGRLEFCLEVEDAVANRTYLTYASEPDEDFFGFGAQFTYFNLKGRRVPIYVMEQGIGRGLQPLTFVVNLVAKAGGAWHTSYISIPHYITSKLHSLFLETYEYAVFDLRNPDRVQISLFSNKMKGSLLAGNSPTGLISCYTEAAGRMRPLPDWILDGAIIGMQGGTDKVRHILEVLQAHDTPIAALWLQDWVGQRRTVVGKQLWWNWELDRKHYPDWEKLISDCNASGIRLMTYINPFLVDPSAKGDFQCNLFQEAMGRGFLVNNSRGEPYLVKNTDFDAAMLDLANPEARVWMKDVIKQQVIGAGASGWMADFGEALPYDAVLHGNIPGSLYHNQYPEVWAKLNREAIEETGNGDDFVFFNRSGYRESPRHSTLFWLGDQMVTWDQHDGIKSAVTGLLSSGISGFSLNHSDIGGYTAINLPVFPLVRNRELLMRWMELNAFSVIFRTHEGISPDVNHQFYTDTQTIVHFSRCARIYTAWACYRKQLVQEAATTGIPVVRHPFLHYPQNQRLRAINFEQFLVGDAFMVAPVLDPGKDRIGCYLPMGQWIHVWSKQEYNVDKDGLEVVVDAPLGKPAVFCKSGIPVTTEFINNLEASGLR